MKICGSCKLEKEFSFYWKRTDGKKLGYHWQCIECEKAKRQTPEFKEKYKKYARTKKRLKNGLDPAFEGSYKTGPKADPNTNWNHRGYRLMLRKNHPNARKDGKIFQHTLVMSDNLGRPLKENESVHHKNGIRHDNSIQNLELWSTSQPCGQRVSDKIAWAIDFLSEYGYKVEKA